MMFVVDGGDFLIANRDYLLHKFVEQVVDGGDFLIANRCGGVQFLHPLIFVL